MKTQGQALVPILNALGLVAMTAHWEFAYGPQVLEQRVSELSYPLLATNVYDQRTNELVFPPYVMKEIGGLRIGVIGIASNIVDKTMPPGSITLNDLYDIIPMNPPVSAVELRGEEILAMLEENLEHTFARNPFDQMRGYVKRCLGLRAYVRIEDPPGHRIHKLFIGDAEVQPNRSFTAAFVTEQGVPRRYGTKREEHPEHAAEAMRTYLAKHRPYASSCRAHLR